MDEQLKNLQHVLLDLLKFFKQFCQENNLHFYLAYGSCLGAIRHKGFIPWDDDVDIIMPPEDYEKLKQIWPNLTSKGSYTLCDTDRNYYDGHLALTIRDDNTTYIRSSDVDLDTNHGIMIEIGRYMYVPKGIIHNYLQMFYSGIYQVYKAQRKPNRGGKALRTIAGIMLAIVPSNHYRYKAWSWAERKMFAEPKQKSGYIRFQGLTSFFNTYFPEKMFSDVAWVPFEDTVMPVPIDYDGYLRMRYGDYMTPPPENERILHKTEFIDTTKSYREYRGIKYLMNNQNGHSK